MLLGGTDGSVQRRASGGQTHNIYETESSGGAHTGDAKGTAGDTSTQVDTSYDPVTQLKKRKVVVSKTKQSDAGTRSQIHLLLVGDPGTGKSQIQRFVASIDPRTIMTS